ncbi:hypothetical protein BPY_07060 [Bifidobacterium psychraerophilum]|uniref:hypothetical protein n=1 Tax=Bifidobacterium psychraerophilum TaxID=218140 RepID=UPI003118379E
MSDLDRKFLRRFTRALWTLNHAGDRYRSFDELPRGTRKSMYEAVDSAWKAASDEHWKGGGEGDVVQG